MNDGLHGDTRYWTLTEDHITLLRNAVISWEHCEYGAPAIDCKRPYGNSDVPYDIAELLGWEWPDEDKLSPREFDQQYEKVAERARLIHQETETALQIILTTGQMTPGQYRCDRYCRNWRPVE